jgi:hypothetical protein
VIRTIINALFLSRAPQPVDPVAGQYWVLKSGGDPFTGSGLVHIQDCQRGWVKYRYWGIDYEILSRFSDNNFDTFQLDQFKSIYRPATPSDMPSSPSDAQAPA